MGGGTEMGQVLAILAAFVALGIATWFLFGRSKRGPEAFAHARATDPDIRAAVAALNRQDAAALLELYTARTPPDRVAFIEALGAASTPDAPLPPDPTGPMAALCAGLSVEWAWRYRGGATADGVTEDGWLNMQRLLEQAERYIARQGDHPDSVSCALGIRTAMGASGSHGAVQRFLNAYQASGEQNIFLPRAHLMFLAPKWHGSVAEIFEAAQSYVRASSGPARFALLAMAHCEALLYQTDMSDDIEERRAAHAYYVQSDDFLRKLEALDDAFWNEVAAAPAMAEAEGIFAHNMLAYLLYRRDVKPRLRRHLEALGPDILLVPWGYSGLGPDKAGWIRRHAGLPA